MAYTETRRTGLGRRLKDSLGGVIVALVFMVGGTILLYWNEGRAVGTAGAIAEVQTKVVERT